MMNAPITYQNIYKLWLFSVLSVLSYTAYVTFFSPADVLHLPRVLLDPAAFIWDYFYESYAFLTETLRSGHSTAFISFLWVFSVTGMYIFYSFIAAFLCRIVLSNRKNKSIQASAL